MDLYNDYKVKGAPADVSAFVSAAEASGADVTPVRTLDGISYVYIRSKNALNVPGNLLKTGAQLSDALVGVFYDTYPVSDSETIDAESSAS